MLLSFHTTALHYPGTLSIPTPAHTSVVVAVVRLNSSNVLSLPLNLRHQSTLHTRDSNVQTAQRDDSSGNTETRLQCAQVITIQDLCMTGEGREEAREGGRQKGVMLAKSTSLHILPYM